jgi:hypothetical protein
VRADLSVLAISRTLIGERPAQFVTVSARAHLTSAKDAFGIVTGWLILVEARGNVRNKETFWEKDGR